MEDAMTTDNGLRCSIRLILTAACLCAATTVATAAEPKESFSLACARHDLQAVMLIEEHGKAGRMAAQKITDAFFIVMRARVACQEGRVGEAIALYDGLALGPVFSQASQ
jgi:hypothetical protein